MEGVLHNYDPLTKEGRIAVGDGEFYDFHKRNFVSRNKRIVNGMGLSFDVEDGVTRNIKFLNASELIKSKSRILAAAFAFFLGMLGAHKVYLGKSGAAIITVLITFICLPLSLMLSEQPLLFLMLSIPYLVVAIICICECFIYLSKTDERFHDAYVVGTKAWF